MGEAAERFLAWRERRGVSITPEVQRIARELAELAAAEPWSEAHVDALIARYRKRIAGARAIMNARAVGEEMCRWFAEHPPQPARSVPPPQAPRTAKRVAPPTPPVGMLRAPAPVDIAEDAITADAITADAMTADAITADNNDEGPSGLELDLDPLSLDEPARDSVLPTLEPVRDSQLPVVGEPVRDSELPPPPPRLEPVRVVTQPPLPSKPPTPVDDAPRSLPAGPVDAAPQAFVLVPSARAPTPWLRVAAAAAVIVIVALVVLRFGWLSSRPAVQVTGEQTSKHLALRFTLPEPWMHADLDREESRDGWDKVWSVYYRGSAATSFDAQLTLMVLSNQTGTPATDLDARTVGANETIGAAARGRQCNPGVHQGTKCNSVYLAGTRLYDAFEYTFVLDGKLIYVRGLFEQARPGLRQEEVVMAGSFVTSKADAEISEIVASLGTIRP